MHAGRKTVYSDRGESWHGVAACAAALGRPPSTVSAALNGPRPVEGRLLTTTVPQWARDAAAERSRAEAAQAAAREAARAVTVSPGSHGRRGLPDPDAYARRHGLTREVRDSPDWDRIRRVVDTYSTHRSGT